MTTNQTLTFDQAVEQFKETHADFMETYQDDTVALKTAWNDYTDFLMEDGEITEHDYDNWDNPF